MVYTTKELLSRGDTEYSIRKKAAAGELHQVERGVYSDESPLFKDEVFLSKKYPNAVFTFLSAYYLHDLTDLVPDCFFLATEQHSFPIRRKDVTQSYQDPSFFFVGISRMEVDGGCIRIYDLERMLLETIRLRERMPADLYYEVMDSFRRRKADLDFFKLNEYAKHFKNGDALLHRIKETV